MSRLARLLPVLTSAAEIPWYLKGGVSAANCIAAYKAIGAASLAASYVNLANPGTYDAADGVAPTFNPTTGWTFDGATQYLTTGITLADSRNSTIVIRFSGVAGDTGYPWGYFTAGGQGFLATPRRGGTRRYYNGNVALNAAASSASGVIALAGLTPYLDGVADGVTNVTYQAHTELVSLIGCFNNNGSPATFFAGAIQALAVYSAELTPAQVGAVSAAMSFF